MMHSGLASAMLLTAAPAQAIPARAEPITIAASGPASCSVVLAGRAFSLPAQDAALAEAMQAVRAQGSVLTVRAGASTPYRCVGGVIFTAQRLGIAIGFTAAPPAQDRRSRGLPRQRRPFDRRLRVR